jgi:hypothetical protein
VNRLTKVIGITGAVAAVVWLLRDRIITVGADRDLEPPRFRSGGDGVVPPSPPIVPPPAADIPVTEISGIGPTYADRLQKAGIGDARALASAEPSVVAGAASVSEERARQWIDEAKTRAREPSASPAS